MATPGEILIKEGEVLKDFETLTPDLTNPSLQITYKRCDGFNETVTGTATFEICTKDPSSTTFDTRFWKVEKVGPCEDSDGPDFPPNDPKPGSSNCKRFSVTNTDVGEGGECKQYNLISTGQQGLIVPAPLPIFVPGALLPRTRVVFVDCNNTVRFIRLKNKRGSVETVCSRIQPVAITGADSIDSALQAIAGASDPEKIEGQLLNLKLKSVIGSQPDIVQLGSCGGGGSQGQTYTIKYTDSKNTAQTATIKPGETVTVNATDKFEGEVLIRENRGALSILSLGTCEDVNEDQDGEDEEEDDIDVDKPGTGLQVLKLSSNLPNTFKVEIVSSKISGLVTLPVELEGANIFQESGLNYRIGDVPVVTNKTTNTGVNYSILDIQASIQGTAQTYNLLSPPQQNIETAAELVDYISRLIIPSPKIISLLFIFEAVDKERPNGSPFGNTDDTVNQPRRGG